MKIRITILAILLILLIIIPIAQTPKTIRDLRLEFEKAARTGFRKTSLEDFVFYFTDIGPGFRVKYNWFFEHRMPTWKKLILDLYDDPSLAELEPYIYASKILQENLKSHDKRKLLMSLYLSYYKPDTQEIRIIEEYAHNKCDKKRKSGLLLYFAEDIKENFYKMQYGLGEDIGSDLYLHQLLYFLERPPESEAYYSICISDTLVTCNNYVMKPEALLNFLKFRFRCEDCYNFCFYIRTASWKTTWKQTWEVLEPLIELSERSPENIEFFFLERKRYDAEFKPEPYELGIKFEKENKSLKNIDIDIRISEKEGISVNGEKKKISDLENIPPNKNIKFTFEKSSPISYFLTILSLIKKSNPKDYYYVVE